MESVTQDTVLICCASIEWLNSQNVAMKKIIYKNAKLILIRNDIREMFLQIEQDKMTTTKLKLKDINVFKKFMAEGKASIKFNAEKCSVYISNAPPGCLIFFLKTLFIKLTKDHAENKTISKDEMNKKLRSHLLSEKSNHFEEISPVTNAELDRAKKAVVSKSTVTTPSPPASKKRRLIDAKGNPKAAKQLYAPSPLSTKSSNGIKPDDTVAVMEVLNEEQNQIMQACLSGHNIFFTGSAGTGKSFLLRKIIAAFPPDGTTITASTGVAACLIGGLVEAVAREVRRNDKPFGGIQLIICGDFFQLPPVVKIDRGNIYEYKRQEPMKRFCFQSKSWQSCISRCFELRKVYRQKDPKFIEILNSIRIGRVTPEITEQLLATARQKIETNGILATQLCSHTKDADSINQNKLANLTSAEKVFEATDSDSYLTKTIDSQLPVPHKLVLKIGAQVMLLKNVNLSTGLVNGARGVIIKYTDGFPVVQFKNKQEYIAKPEKWVIKTPTGSVLQRKQVPLKLAWAFSIHKSQGLTLDCLEMSLSKVFEAGQAYVALSRAQSLDSVRIIDFEAKTVFADPQVLLFYRNFRRQIMEVPNYIPLGQKKQKNDLKRTLSGLKLTKSIMDKPLVTIN
ncbi:CLUMA_CG007205, isoform A [Clunio marinus]|uniref:ATP-dependent DNA helicase n=1 Tax=Clunio marinus TaxID=568069 RepID=A0A1J1I261_9DIPT|nr:CLUMA_CG007205, isoform A [Clunio marinus]